jgi:glycosyltransferase involved in cell wall biosynthesis
VIYPALQVKNKGALLVMDWADWFGRGGSVEERQDPILRSTLRYVETYYEEHYRDRAAGTTVINRFLQDRAISLGVRPDSILLLRNGSDTRSQPVTLLEARQQLGIQAAGPLIGFVGGLYPNDANLMAKAFNQVIEEYPSTRLVLIGYFNREIETLLQDPGSVIRTGPLTSQHVHLYLSACDLCWLPLGDSGANLGRWPYKLNDYMTAGRATVSTNIGDLKEVIPAYQLGVVTQSDPVSFASGTLKLLDAPELALSLGKSARKAAENHFDWKIITRDLEDFYLRILSLQTY